MRYFYLLTVLILIFASCGQKSGGQNSPDGDTTRVDTIEPEVIKEIEINAEYTAFANCIAGEYYDTSFFPAGNLPRWKQYKKLVDKEWQDVLERIINPMDKFVDKKIEPVLDKEITLFYPFSGPDFLFAEHYYPGMKTMKMAGLEPIGTIPDFSSVDANSMYNYLMALKNALFFPNKYGFYRTKSMEVDFTDNRLNGTVHHLLFYIAKHGYSIVDVQPMEIDDQGLFRPVGYSSKLQMVEVTYCDSNRVDERVVYYISADLSDMALEKNNKNVMNFYKQDSVVYTLLKSASYLLHKPYFSTIHDYIMERSLLVVQDDSGMPYRSFSNDPGWKVELYGRYSRTIPLFHNLYQADLAKAYKNQDIEDLDFKIGYNISHGEYNLMIMKKLNKH